MLSVAKWLEVALLLISGVGGLVSRAPANGIATDSAYLKYRVIVVNLDRRPDRLEKVSVALAEHPSSLLNNTCRLRAFDGRDSTDTRWLVDKGLVDSSGLQPSTDGMIGCYASHWNALRLIASDSSIDFGIVVEDDLQYFSPDFVDKFAMLWNNTQGEAERFWKTAGWVYLQRDARSWSKGQARSRQPTVLRPKRSDEWPKNTAMYAVKRTEAQRLATTADGQLGGAMMPMQYEVDSILPGIVQDVWIFDPPIAQALGRHERGGDTDVQELSGERRGRLIQDCELPAQLELPPSFTQSRFGSSVTYYKDGVVHD